MISPWQMTPPGQGLMDNRGMVCMIYKEEFYILIHTKYESSGPSGFGAEDFFLMFFSIVSLWKLMATGKVQF